MKAAVKRACPRLAWLVLTIGVSVAAVSAVAATKSVWSGVYSEAQAADGGVLYGEHCATCHGEDLGGIEQAPALAGGTFGEKWSGATLKKLFDRVESMPPTRPKSLSGKQYADVMAYLLSASELPAGTVALAPDPAELADIIFSRVRPQQ